MRKIAQLIGNLKTFMQEVKVELQKCSWPTRKELFGQSVVVIISVIILGLFVGLFDLINMGFLRIVIKD